MRRSDTENKTRRAGFKLPNTKSETGLNRHRTDRTIASMSLFPVAAALI